MAGLTDLVVSKLAELAGKLIAKGVDYAGRKLLGPDPEPEGQPLPYADVKRQQEQIAAATSHKVK